MENSFNPKFLIGGLLVWTLFAMLIWLGWRSRSWMPKPLTIALRGIVGLVSAFFLVAMIWFCWEFRPWMPAGRTVHLHSERIGDYEFQVWQRKNADFSEPFATGLFVRKQSGGQWQAFLVDFEDGYRPNVVLRKEGSTVTVISDDERWGHFDEKQQKVFRRRSDGDHALDPFATVPEPPGDWWLKESGARR